MTSFRATKSIASSQIMYDLTNLKTVLMFIVRILLLKLHVSSLLIFDHHLVCCTGKFIGFSSNLFPTQVWAGEWWEEGKDCGPKLQDSRGGGEETETAVGWPQSHSQTTYPLWSGNETIEHIFRQQMNSISSIYSLSVIMNWTVGRLSKYLYIYICSAEFETRMTTLTNRFRNGWNYYVSEGVCHAL